MYTIPEAKNTVETLSRIFDIVRIVEPISQRIITFDSNNDILYDEYRCHKVWTKEKRCHNCISLKAINDGHRLTKYEFVEDDIYYVVSQPIELICKDETMIRCTIEIISKITDEVFFGTFGNSEIINKIIESEKKVYTDSLTQVYNRRYYDDKMFCHNAQHEQSKHVVFIVMDLNSFKLINDNYGHTVGDWVLFHAGQAMMECVRSQDSVIRLGGDEFLIVLNNCVPEAAERIISNIQANLQKKVIYDSVHNKYAVGDFGIAYTDKFEPTEECIAGLMKQADETMYENKKNCVSND